MSYVHDVKVSLLWTKHDLCCGSALHGHLLSVPNSFLKVSAPAFEAKNELVGTVPAEQLVAQTDSLGRLKPLRDDMS